MSNHDTGITGLTAIAKHLNEQGILTARGSTFTAMAVKRVLAR